MTDFGKYLKKLRIDRNEILYDMARKLDVSAAFLSSIETGKRSVPIDIVPKLVKLYNLDSEQEFALQTLADQTVKQVRLSLQDTTNNKRDLALSFARRFEEMNPAEVSELLRLLKKED